MRPERGFLFGTSTLWHRLVRTRYAVQALVDGIAWAIALPVATALRFEFDLDRVDAGALIALLPIAAAAQFVSGAAGGLYTGRWRFGSFDEVAALARAIVLTGVAVGFANRYAFDVGIPTSAAIASVAISLVLTSGARYIWRLLLERRLRPTLDESRRVLVFGAGEGGVQVITAMMRNPDSPYYPVALLDDDPNKGNLRVTGVPVVGGRRDIARVADDFSADALIVAIPSAEASLIRELADIAAGAELPVMVLPPVTELFDGDVGVTDIRPISEVDLLGRRAIDTDVASIAGYLTDRRVLVTGAGGSIGAELCRQIYRFAPEALIMVERDESALHAVQLSLEGRALLDDPNLVVCDIRDAERVDEVFGTHRPEVVFHAAALKHLTLLERHPTEAIKTNVWGTQNLLDAAIRHDVHRFVNVSTDKAADPTSVLGYTKRIAERLTASAALRADGTFLSVRFGNVLGSRGSVLTSFHAQISAGGPVTVTDPDVTRYFMTVEEAVQLVVQAGAVGRDGEALVLDMGDPVRIDDVARRLVANADRAVEVVYTGLRPGEKLHEVLLAADEVGTRPFHPLIAHVPVAPLSPLDVAGVAGVDPAAITAAIRGIAATT